MEAVSVTEAHEQIMPSFGVPDVSATVTVGGWLGTTVMSWVVVAVQPLVLVTVTV